MKRICIVLCLLLPVAALGAPRYHLVRVVVAGSERYGQNDLVHATGLSPNSDVSMDDLQQAANRIGSCGAFSSVQFEYKAANGPRDSVEADFKVKDAEKYLPVVFENLVWYSDAELQRALHETVPLFNGSLPLSGTLPDDLKAAIGRLQTSRSLPAEISYMLAGDMGQTPSFYRFKVDNANLRIKDFRFSGTDHMPPDALGKAVAAARGSEYMRTNVAKLASTSLLSLYGEHGYLQVAIRDIQPSLEDGAVVISVSVSEGAQYRLAGYTWSGNSLVSGGELSRNITLKAGETVDSRKLAHDLAQARKLFLKFGREAAVITPLPAFANDSVTYVFAVKEGDLYRMGELDIEGFDPDLAGKLKASWKLAPGTPYDNTYIMDFMVRTHSLAHGHQENWYVVEQPDDAEKIVNVRLQLKAD